MLRSPEEELDAKGVKNYEFMRSSGKPDRLSPKMVPVPRNEESEVLKDSRQAFFSLGES